MIKLIEEGRYYTVDNCSFITHVIKIIDQSESFIFCELQLFGRYSKKLYDPPYQYTVSKSAIKRWYEVEKKSIPIFKGQSNGR